jgi:hypothetical protein
MEPDLHMIRRKRKTQRDGLSDKAHRDKRPRDVREWEQNTWLPYDDDEAPTQENYDFMFAHDWYKSPENGKNTQQYRRKKMIRVKKRMKWTGESQIQMHGKSKKEQKIL